MGGKQSDTADRYLIKLFRSFTFHQQLDDGAPSLDFGHMVYMLNKLDAGSRERIALMGADEAHLMVVGFDDVKRCVEAEFGDLRARAKQSQAAAAAQVRSVAEMAGQ